MIVHFSFLFVSEPQFFVCLLILKQMPISVKALTAEGRWRTKQRVKKVFIRDKWKIKVQRQIENVYFFKFSLCL